MNVMRKYLASLVFALSVVAVVPAFAATAATASTTEETAAPSAVAVQHVRVPLPGLRDEAAMVLVGTALIGLGAALRRSA
jgi:hypothetical protein